MTLAQAGTPCQRSGEIILSTWLDVGRGITSEELLTRAKYPFLLHETRFDMHRQRRRPGEIVRGVYSIRFPHRAI